MAASRLSRLCKRSLSVFNPSSQLWLPIVSSRCAPSQGKAQPALQSSLSLITQNLDAFSSRPIARAEQLLGGILKESEGPPDIIFLQEVRSDVRTSILSNPEVREAFLVTDAEDLTSFKGVPFANMTLLSSKRFTFNLESQKDGNGVERGEKFMLGPVSRIELPSKYGRCALSVDIIPASTLSTPTLAYCLINMEILANLLREPGCGGGLIAGDFNAISPKDHTLLDKNGLVDAWVALYGKQGLKGATWGVGGERHDGGRLDKVAMLGVEAKDMEILRPGLIEVPKPSKNSDLIPCSDHCGLRLSFTI
ncbi:unnamed protein product [Cyclocybe aegerita]|uniref:Endonuclease/exonuclease/phosphatase domain-containing protein n=1 Tax=Cyclocybe aegerita TaxID=1973307 RepID=A0A8S0VYD4_CYCAE|nr:unnamed protein product [Cyclocybe aegerita]